MNEASRWRFALAEQIAAAYAQNPKTAAIMIAGSVGRGRADRYSDIEIDVYYMAAPTVAERIAAVEGAGAIVESLDEDEDEWEEQMLLGGVHAATSTFLVSTLERYLSEVVDQGQIAPSAQMRLHSLLNAQPVWGHELAEQWRAKARHYPDTLARAMLHENLRFAGFGYGEEMLAARDDQLQLYSDFVKVEQQILKALLGLNHIYLMTPEALKWMDENIEAMAIRPVDLSGRLKRAFHVEPIAGVQLLKSVIGEVFDLVEQHVPDFDVTPYRQRMANKRQVLDHLPQAFGST